MLRTSFYINYKKVLKLVVTGNNTKNTVIQKKYKKYSIFVKNAGVSKNCRVVKFLLDFLKLHGVLSICATFQVSPIRNKVGGDTPNSKYEVKIPRWK